MCEQTPVAYNCGDVVWVKLGPCWWPGEVVSFNELPSDVIESFKKPPLAAVKFFDEENYEFVRNLNNIYSYNCSKKYEFIKKGLDLHRAKNSFMEKFPGDVCMAESKTGGNPNILNDPKLTPEKRTSYTEIFGSPTPKRSSKESLSRVKNKIRANRSQSSYGSPKKTSTLVTHPRFLSKGKDDHQIRILIQASDANKLPEKEYTCHTCGFRSTRVDIIVLHNKSHIKGVYTPVFTTKKSKRSSPKKPRRARKVSQSKTSADEDTPTHLDITSNLLAEWDNDDDNLSENASTSQTFPSSSDDRKKSDELGSENALDSPFRKSVKYMKMSHSKTSSIDEDLALLEKGLPLYSGSSSDESDDDLLKIKTRHSRSFPSTSSPLPTMSHVLAVIGVGANTKSDSECVEDNEVTELNFRDNKQKRTKLLPSKRGKKDSSSDESDYSPIKTKRKQKNVAPAKTKRLKVSAAPKTDITSDLLAEWDDDEDEPEVQSNPAQILPASEKDEVVQEPDNTKDGKDKSCFDFDEEDDTHLLAQSEEGRKIPRVIPPAAGKRKSIESAEVRNSVRISESSPKISGEKEELCEEQVIEIGNKRENAAVDADIEAFNDVLATTVVPRLPEIPRLLKCEQNFRNAKMIKFPDKDDNEVGVSNKDEVEDTDEGRICASDDKQVSEDLGILVDSARLSKKTESFKADAGKHAELAAEVQSPISHTFKHTGAHIEVRKSVFDEYESRTSIANKNKRDDQTVAVDAAVCVEPGAVDASKQAEAVSDIQKSTTTDFGKLSEVATKLTNPKKRFVKTFEDETKNLTGNEDKTPPIGKNEQEKGSVEEVKNLEVSKLKTLLMSKLNEGSNKKKSSSYLTDYKKYTCSRPRKFNANFDFTTKVDFKPPETLLSDTKESPNVAKPSEGIKQSSESVVKAAGVDFTPNTVESETTAESDKNDVPVSKVDAQCTESRAETEGRDVEEPDEYSTSSKASDETEKPEDVAEEEGLNRVTNDKERDAVLKPDVHEELYEKSCGDDDLEKRATTDWKVEENVKSPCLIGDTDDSNLKHETEGSRSEDDETHALSIPADGQENVTSKTDEESAFTESGDSNAKEMTEITMASTVSELSKPEKESSTKSGAGTEIIGMEGGGNLTVVSEMDLADKQVEITTNVLPSKVDLKPITLSSFSMDFCEDDLDIAGSNSVSSIVEKAESEKDETTKGATRSQVSVKLQQDVEEDINSFEINKHVGLEDSKTVTSKDDDRSLRAKSVEEPYHDIGPGSFAETKESTASSDSSVESEMAKITDTTNDQEVLQGHLDENTSSTKLLEILTDVKPKSSSQSRHSPAFSTLVKKPTSKADSSILKEKSLPAKAPGKYDPKTAKFGGRPSVSGISKLNKPKILPEKVIKPEPQTMVSVKKVTCKRSYQDVEDIDTFIIQKPIKRMAVSSESDVEDVAPKPTKSGATTQKGKARILQQTIITPTGDIIQPTVSQGQSEENMFDINSMPIVLDDQILTPEGIENMPIVLQDSAAKKTAAPQVKLLNKSPAAPSVMKEAPPKPSLVKQYAANKQTKIHKVYQTGSAKFLKNNPAVITQPGKPGKFIIVPSTSTHTGAKYTVGKRPPIIKRSAPAVTRVQSIAPEPTGNKIMIVTNNLGQQQRVLLTPAQQKMLSHQNPGAKIKPTIKSNILQKTMAKGANIISHTIVSSKGQVTTLASQTLASPSSQVFTSMAAQQLKNVKVEATKTKRGPVQNQRLYLQGPVKPSTSSGGTQRTIIIRNPQGQTVKRIQSNDDSMIEQQVAEQIQAINRASAKMLPKDVSLVKTKTPAKKSYTRKSFGPDSPKIIPQTKTQAMVTPSLVSTASAATSNKPVSLPPLAPISPAAKKSEPSYSQSVLTPSTESASAVVGEEPKRLPHQLVIQDAHGNQTTITEGQILALPSEAVDGQPQSYVLVTLDETGNLAPLNNEALMSLDPNLSLGGDLGNMILQIDQSATSEADAPNSDHQEVVVSTQGGDALESTEPANVLAKAIDREQLMEPPQNVALCENDAAIGSGPNETNNVQAVAINSGDTGQQLIITGDPISTQKFLESLTEGNADLANLLANAEGNILIQAEGQQILINTDAENQMLLTVNPENLNATESPEGNGNPVFGSQPLKNQDILAAALADTDVFQQDPSISHSPSKVVMQSQLSPSSALYPIHAGNVLETNSMSSPIMTPLEIQSTNTKKIDDEADILSSQVPKNVDLPITITDPNIAQTVAHQQVASLMPSALELPLAIQDPNMSVTSEMNSPSFVYSLPTLDDTVDMSQKAFSTSISMPLLTEDPEESLVTPPVDASNVLVTTEIVDGTDSVPQECLSAADSSKDLQVSELNDEPVGGSAVLSSEIETGNKPELMNTTDRQNVTETSSSSDVVTDLSPRRVSSEMDLPSINDKKTELKSNFMDTEGLCTMRGGICNSLSEPPPDMFDFSIGDGQNFENAEGKRAEDTADIIDVPVESSLLTPELSSNGSDTAMILQDVDGRSDDVKSDESKPAVDTNLQLNSPGTNTDDSCEIPVQPEIVTDLTSKSFRGDNGVNDSNFETNSVDDEGDV